VNQLAASEATWPSLAVVVPVYNEAPTIEGSIHTIAEALGDYPGGTFVIAVDDGSSDDSAEILARVATALDRCEVLYHRENAGYGQALRSGAARALELRFDYVAFIDSDGTNHPSDLLKIGELAAAGHPYIKASRFAPGGNMTGVPLARRCVTRTGNLVASTLFGTSVRDVTNGFRAGRTEFICSLDTHERSFAVIVEEFALALVRGVEAVEFPTSLSARSKQQRPSAFSYSPNLVWAYLRYPLRARVRRLRRPRWR
jgi:dolichol-phosphate mannosyltransferase